MSYFVLLTTITAKEYDLYFFVDSLMLTSMSYLVLLTIITANEYELYCFC